MFKILIVFTCVGLVSAITEREAVQSAIKSSPDAKILTIEAVQDSITYQKALASRSLSLQVGANVEVKPSTSVETDASYTAAANQPVKGGGFVSASTSNSYKSDGIDASSISVGVTQPFLKGSFGNGEVDVAIKVASNNIKLSRLKFRDGILAAAAEARNAFWDWVLAGKTVEITLSEMAYADSLKIAAVARFRVGSGTETDTLSASITVLRAYEQNLAAKHRERQAKENLAFILGVGIETLSEPQTDGLIPKLTVFEQALDSMKKLSYPLAILATTVQNIQISAQKAANNLLPTLDANAGYRIISADKASKSEPYVGLSLTWDVLAKNARLEKKDYASRLMSSEAEKEKAEKELVFKLKQLYDAWKQDSVSLSIRDAEIVIAEKAYGQLQESFRLGASGSLELERAKNDLINARLNRLSSEISLRKAVIAIDQVSGVVLNRFGVVLP
jgi:outer membrane protein TolC